MGQMIKTINNIAKIDKEPAQVSLSAVPNYIQMSSLNSEKPNIEPIELEVNEKSLNLGEHEDPKLMLTITSLKDNTAYKFYGTDKENQVNATTFFVKGDRKEITTQNLKACLMKNNFISSNFELSVNFNENTIYIMPLGVGEGYGLKIEYDDKEFFECVSDSYISTLTGIGVEMEMKNVKVNIGLDASEYIKTQSLFSIKSQKAQKTIPYYIMNASQNLQYIFGVPLNSYFEDSVESLVELLNRLKLDDSYWISFAKQKATKIVLHLKDIEDENNISFENVNLTYFEKPQKIYTYTYTHTFTFPSNDTLDNGKDNALIELDVYTDSKVRLGEPFPFNKTQQGRYMTTIQKAYFKQPLWFNLNATFGNSTSYSIDFLDDKKTGWQDAGTCKDFRFLGYKNDGVNKVSFCYSEIFYVINGYGRNLDDNSMEKFIYTAGDSKKISPLTLQPTLTHTEGQTQLFNFIASTPNNVTGTVALVYKLHTQSGQEIDQIVAHEIAYNDLKVVNTIKLEIDQMMQGFDNVGIVKVCLISNNVEVSTPLTFRILPSCLHKAKDFAFLNSLGGWSSFGFADNRGTDFSTSSETIFKTQTPDYTISSQIESVHSKEAKEQFTIQSMPIRPEVAEWLREMSTSQAVYELSSKRYVIVEDMKVKYNTSDDLLRVEMKYRYSDSYNGRI